MNIVLLVLVEKEKEKNKILERKISDVISSLVKMKITGPPCIPSPGILKAIHC